MQNTVCWPNWQKMALGEHFCGKYDSKYLLVKVIEKVTPDSEHLRLQRKKYWIERLDTKVPYGLKRTGFGIDKSISTTVKVDS